MKVTRIRHELGLDRLLEMKYGDEPFGPKSFQKIGTVTLLRTLQGKTETTNQQSIQTRNGLVSWIIPARCLLRCYFGDDAVGYMGLMKD